MSAALKNVTLIYFRSHKNMTWNYKYVIVNAAKKNTFGDKNVFFKQFFTGR